MARPRHILPLALALSAAAAPASAQAKPVHDLWATVNICDSKQSPDTMGVRARMPGSGKRERLYMRFTAQYRDGDRWKVVSGSGRSRWLYAGSGLFENQEIGYTFPFDEPEAGSSFLVRGLVQFQWRDDRRHLGRLRTVVTRRSHRYTSGGHHTPRAEPPGYSRATCRIKGPAPD